jgi:hypothetical protein
MPRRLDNDQVRQKFIAAGYVPDNDFNYKNNKQKHRVYDILNNKFVKISLQTLDYNIKKGHRPLWEEPPMLANEDPEYLNGLERFAQRVPELPVDIQQQTFNHHQQIIRNIQRKQNFTYCCSLSNGNTRIKRL